ncbi:MAG: hypothetical protein OQK03_04790, partial [Colwellia sp.]|nr:hypothetical protein [Colwellia sp.]
MTTFKSLLSSFTIKLFVWFWLIAIASIVSTRFISQQLSSEAFNKVAIQPALHDELRQLHSTAKRIERSKVNSINELIEIRQKRFAQTPFNIWFKSIDNPQEVMSMFPLPMRHQEALVNYLSNQNFSQPQISAFSHTK